MISRIVPLYQTRVLSLECTIVCPPRTFPGSFLALITLLKSNPLVDLISALTRTTYIRLDLRSVRSYASQGTPSHPSGKNNIQQIYVPPRTSPISYLSPEHRITYGGMIRVDNLLRLYGGLSIYLPFWLRIRCL